MNLRRVARLGCLAAAVSVCAGCGLPVESSPQSIPPGQMPLALRETASDRTTSWWPSRDTFAPRGRRR